MATQAVAMDLAPVIDLDTVRRRATARRLLALGVPLATITATRTDDELADLWTRERTIASLRRLTGNDRYLLDRHSTDELVEIEKRTVTQLMGSDRRTSQPDQLIYSIGGRQPKHPADRRRQHLRAWGITA